MPTPDQIRIEMDRARPRLVELWWALRPLTSVVRFMQTGAHPDDEISGMLAALAFRDGINISYACSTRGEGGQNDTGTEAGPALGALRTREMERACDILGMRMYWHSETPDDTIRDFGFSKSGEETLGLWGHDRTLARFVDIVRDEKPDIICPTFLDVPGQHGHHRAMTQTAHEVMAAAADPAFPSNRAPWQVKKLYLPAWSGAGQSYDDDLPPPPATLTIDGRGVDPVSGWSWERIGQQSRAFHRTQGMGRWVPVDHVRDWPLHLAESHVAGPDVAVTSGMAANLGDLAQIVETGTAAKDLIAAQAAIDETLDAFPDSNRIAAAALRAIRAVRAARADCPENWHGEIDHRLAAKEVQLGHVLRLALGVDVHCRVGAHFLVPGQSTELTLDVAAGQAEAVEVACDLPDGWEQEGDALRLSDAAGLTQPYRVTYDPAVPDAPAAVVQISHGGETFSVRLPMDTPPVVLPRRMARATPNAAVINLQTDRHLFSVRVDDVQPEGCSVTLDAPKDWAVERLPDGFLVTVPRDLPERRYDIPILVDGAPAMAVQKIEHPHTAPTAMSRPAKLSVLALRADLARAKVGYVGAGNDRVGHWLTALGADVTELTDRDLASEAALASFDTIVIGIFAMRFRAGLSQAMPRLHGWTRAGGTLVTLYHRPWDNWVPQETPPLRLEIGQPSLRWRVTDETAEVRHLADHPILTTPNQIGPEDWDGWVKERGLYFAKSWDDAYTPLVEMADPGEAPHKGALLAADVGKGRHIHTSLILHHQMENLVPGAFRLMANLLAPRA